MGGGLYAGGQAQVMITHSVLQANWASWGGETHFTLFEQHHENTSSPAGR